MPTKLLPQNCLKHRFEFRSSLFFLCIPVGFNFFHATLSYLGSVLCCCKIWPNLLTKTFQHIYSIGPISFSYFKFHSSSQQFCHHRLFTRVSKRVVPYSISHHSHFQQNCCLPKCSLLLCVFWGQTHNKKTNDRVKSAEVVAPSSAPQQQTSIQSRPNRQIFCIVLLVWNPCLIDSKQKERFGTSKTISQIYCQIKLPMVIHGIGVILKERRFWMAIKVMAFLLQIDLITHNLCVDFPVYDP